MSLPVLPTATSAPAASANAGPPGLPLLRLGFRPFYLGAAAFACVAVPLWVALYFGVLSLDVGIAPLLWHAHEMLFGFAAAVIAGFLMTAGKAWTGLATPRGAFLGALAGLWLAARIAAFTAPYPVYAALDVLLLPVVAARHDQRVAAGGQQAQSAAWRHPRAVVARQPVLSSRGARRLRPVAAARAAMPRWR